RPRQTRSAAGSGQIVGGGRAQGSRSSRRMVQHHQPSTRSRSAEPVALSRRGRARGARLRGRRAAAACHRCAYRTGYWRQVVDRIMDSWLRAAFGNYAAGALEDPGGGPLRADKVKRPQAFAGVIQLVGKSKLVAMRGVPGNSRNIGAADTNVGKLAVAQARQFVQALIIALPLLDEADECGKHNVLLSLFLCVRSGLCRSVTCSENRDVPSNEK